MIGNGSDRWWWRRRLAEPSTAWDLVATPALCLGRFSTVTEIENDDDNENDETTGVWENGVVVLRRIGIMRNAPCFFFLSLSESVCVSLVREMCVCVSVSVCVREKWLNGVTVKCKRRKITELALFVPTESDSGKRKELFCL